LVSYIDAFVDSEPEFISARRRVLRDKDRVKLLPGQHPGLGLQFSINTGDICRVNIYGGIRDADTPFDLRDSILAKELEKTHADRTHQILSQHTELGWHIKDSMERKIAEAWMRYFLNTTFNFDRGSIGEQDDIILVGARLSGKDKGFDYFKNNLHSIVTGLIVLTS